MLCGGKDAGEQMLKAMSHQLHNASLSFSQTKMKYPTTSPSNTNDILDKCSHDRFELKVTCICFDIQSNYFKAQTKVIVSKQNRVFFRRQQSKTTIILNQSRTFFRRHQSKVSVSKRYLKATSMQITILSKTACFVWSSTRTQLLSWREGESLVRDS